MPDEPDGTHRVVGKRYVVGRPPTVYEVGDRLTPPESALRAHPDRFVAVEAADDSEPEPDLPPAVPHDMTVAQLASWADGVDDPEALRAAFRAEEASQDRVTAKEALTARLNALVDDGED